MDKAKNRGHVGIQFPDRRPLSDLHSKEQCHINDNLIVKYKYLFHVAHRLYLFSDHDNVLAAWTGA